MFLKMIQENVRQDLTAFVPSSIIRETKCFIFYDNHPRGNRQIDVLVCTQRKEVIEFYNREQISSLLLNTSQNFREVRSFRNVSCELFYFVATDDELFILSSKNNLDLVHRLTDVESYEVIDAGCSGKACLKLISKDDAVPLLFDDNFKIINERNELDAVHTDDSAPIIMQLTRKLKEVEYNIKCNENKYNEYLNLRKMAIFHLYQKITPSLNESLFNLNSKEVASSMNLKTWEPWVKLCNKEVVVAFNLLNNNDVLLKDVYVLLNSITKRSLVYTTKLFQQIDNTWIEIKDQHIKPNSFVTVVTCMDIKELQNDAISGLEFDMVLAFKKSGQNYLLPFDKISISASDVMGEHFEVLATNNKDEDQTFLSILATSERITLLLRHIKDQGDANTSLLDIFKKYLKMDKFETKNNVFIHKSSPYHALYGVMVVCEDDVHQGDHFTIQVHSRSSSQIVSLIHYINDIVPFRIIITTPNYKITSNTKELTNYNEEISLNNEQIVNYIQLGSSALNQTSILLEYLDKCMIKMSLSKDQAILNKVGSEIDMFACGLEKFLEFRTKLMNELDAGINMYERNESINEPISQNSMEIIIDDDEM